MSVRVSKWGNSLAVRLPKAVLDKLNLREGQRLDIIVEGREARLKPVSARPSLEDIVAEIKRLGPESEPKPVDWGADEGREIIQDAYSKTSK